MKELKKSWEDAAVHKKLNSVKEPDYIPSKFGPSSFQVFDGEDVLAEERAKLKKEQMQRWTQEQIVEHAMMKQNSLEEDNAYAEMLRQIDAIREQVDQEEKAMHKDLIEQVAAENRVVRCLCLCVYSLSLCVAGGIPTHEKRKRQVHAVARRGRSATEHHVATAGGRCLGGWHGVQKGYVPWLHTSAEKENIARKRSIESHKTVGTLSVSDSLCSPLCAATCITKSACWKRSGL